MGHRLRSVRSPSSFARQHRLHIEALEDRRLLAAGPWEFLSATSQIQQVPDSGGNPIFRGSQTGDFDADGDLDVVVVTNRSSAGVTGTPYPGILYMNENGKFVNRTAQYFPDLLIPAERWWVSPGDYFDEDIIDLYVAGAAGDPSKFYKNLGSSGGNWLGFQEQSFRIRGPSKISAASYYSEEADLNGDGREDVVEFNMHPELGLGQTRVLINNGRVLRDETATRMPQRQEPTIWGEVVDFNGDTFPDIAMSNLNPSGGTPKLRLLINDGTGNFPVSLEQTVLQPHSSSIGTYGIDNGDFNGDGKMDLYVINFGISGNGARDGIVLNLGSGNNLLNTIYYPTFNGTDSDGDHAEAGDFDGDGKLDIAVAQFAAKTFVLHNQSTGTGGIPTLVERTPPQVPNGAAYRASAFDANGDGRLDLWIGHNPVNQGSSLMIANVPEVEPNGNIAAATLMTAFPALATGVVGAAGDIDVFALPARAYTEGTTVRLRPAAGVDLRLKLLDAGGNVIATSQSGGNGALEQLNAGAGTLARYAQVELQGTLGSGIYRLEIDVL